jgi:hypothetical protein
MAPWPREWAACATLDRGRFGNEVALFAGSAGPRLSVLGDAAGADVLRPAPHPRVTAATWLHSSVFDIIPDIGDITHAGVMTCRGKR